MVDMTTVPMSKVRNNRNPHLDCARGIAALLVLAGHLRAFVFLDYVDLISPNLIAKVFYFLTSLGHQAVMIFFVLSGFLIAQSIQTSVTSKYWSWGNYAINRLTRLWTVLLPTLLFTALWDTLGKSISGSEYYLGEMWRQYSSGPQLGNVQSLYSLSSFIGNLFFLQTITVPPFGTNGPLWSLANEFWYYVIFPLLYLLMKHSLSLVEKLLYVSILILLFIFLPVDLLLLGPIWLLGYIVTLMYKHKIVIRFCSTFGYAMGSCIVLIVVLFFARMQLISTMFADFVVGVSFMFVMFGLLNYQSNHTIYIRASSFLSNISYTLYLTHFPLLSFLFSVILKNRQYRFGISGFIVFGVMFIISIAYAYVLYLLFEKNTNKAKLLLLRLVYSRFPLLQS